MQESNRLFEYDFYYEKQDNAPCIKCEVYTVNTKLTPLRNVQETARFLMEELRFWSNKRRVFDREDTFDLPEEEWSYYYNTRRNNWQLRLILRRLFGSYENFNDLPFVESAGNGGWWFSFNQLKHFAENGWSNKREENKYYRVVEQRRERHEEEERCRQARTITGWGG